MACLLDISYKLNNPDLSKLIMIESDLRLSLQICLHLPSDKNQSVNRNDNVRPFRLDDADASGGITPVVILWVTSHKRIQK